MSAFLNSNTPLNIANGNRIGSYYENRCERKSPFFRLLRPKPPHLPGNATNA
jgi:hypothetical protein